MAALRELAASTNEVTKVRCRFVCDRPVPVSDPNTATHLFRIAQEAVSNALKHASAKSIVISLGSLPGRLLLAVRDDGAGMPARAKPRTGLGLRIMRHRAGLIGGTLAVQREAGGGTAVVCTVHSPLASPAKTE